MTTIEDDVRAALRQRAEAHEVTVPPVEDLIGMPYADAPAPPSRRRLVVGVAAALLAVALGAAAVALTRGDGAEPQVPATTTTSAVPEPVAGTHGAILTGFGPPVDGFEWVFPTSAPADLDAAGPLVVLGERDDEGEVVVAFTDDTGHSSFDVPARDGGTPVEVGGRPAVRHGSNVLHPDLLTLSVERDGGERLFVAGRNVDWATLEDLAAAALAATDPLSGWWPEDRYTATFAGPDRNPFARTIGDERQMAYEVDGRATTITFQAGAADPVDYAWFHDGGTVTEVDGHRVVRWASAGPVGPMAAWAEAGGMVVVSGPEDVLDTAVAAVRMVDRATWEAELASATARGSRFQTGTTEAPPVTTR